VQTSAVRKAGCSDLQPWRRDGAAEGQRLLTVAVGKQSEVADLNETGGQHMEQEAADELDRVELHYAAAVAMSGVSPSAPNVGRHVIFCV